MMSQLCLFRPMIALLVLVQVALAGCGGGGAPPAAAPSGGAAAPASGGAPPAAPAAASPAASGGAAGQPRQGGTFRAAIIGDATMNPFTWPGQLPTTLAAKPLYDTLTKYNKQDLSPVPDLATEWKPLDNGLAWE